MIDSSLHKMDRRVGSLLNLSLSSGWLDSRTYIRIAVASATISLDRYLGYYSTQQCRTLSSFFSALLFSRASELSVIGSSSFVAQLGAPLPTAARFPPAPLPVLSAHRRAAALRSRPQSVGTALVLRWSSPCRPPPALQRPAHAVWPDNTNKPVVPSALCSRHTMTVCVGDVEAFAFAFAWNLTRSARRSSRDGSSYASVAACCCIAPSSCTCQCDV